MFPISIATGNRHNNLFTGNAFRARTAVEGWAGMRSTVTADGSRDALKWTTRAEDDPGQDGQIDSAPIGIYYPNFFTTGPGGHLGAGAKLKFSFMAEADASGLDTSMETAFYFTGDLADVDDAYVISMKNPTTNAKAQYYEFIWTYKAGNNSFYIGMKDTSTNDAIDATTGELDNLYMWNFECYEL